MVLFAAPADSLADPLEALFRTGEFGLLFGVEKLVQLLSALLYLLYLLAPVPVPKHVLVHRLRFSDGWLRVRHPHRLPRLLPCGTLDQDTRLSRRILIACLFHQAMFFNYVALLLKFVPHALVSRTHLLYKPMTLLAPYHSHRT